MSALRDRYARLVKEYRSLERELFEIQTQKRAAKESLKKIETELKKLTKQDSLKEAVALVAKLEKELENRMVIFSEKIEEYEKAITGFKSGQEANGEDFDNILEEI